MAGGAGDDRYSVDSTTDTVSEAIAGGLDTVESTVTHTLSDNVENLTLLGGAAAIDGTGNAENNQITGNDGANKLTGLTGADTLSGGLGADTLDGGVGGDNLDGGDGADTVDGGSENDTLSGGAANDTLAGGTGDDKMIGGAGNDIYVVDSGSDATIEDSTTATIWCRRRSAIPGRECRRSDARWVPRRPAPAMIWTIRLPATMSPTF